MKQFFKTHGDYFTNIYTYSFYLFCITSAFGLLMDIVRVGNEGQFGTVVFLIFLSEIIVPIRAFLATAIWGTVIVILGFVPYLIVRAFKRKKNE